MCQLSGEIVAQLCVSDRGSAPASLAMSTATFHQLQDARLYALLHRGNPGDAQFYVRRCRGARHALELGVGAGRIAGALASAGVPVTGIDNHAGLLELAKRDLVETGAAKFQLVLTDMRSFELGAKFDRIVIPYSGLFCLLDAASVQACLTRCRQHLMPNGRLLFDVYEADSFHADCEPDAFDESEREHVVDLADDETRLSVFERSTWNKATQRLEMTYEYFDEQGRLLHSSLVRHRYWLLDQFAPTLAEAGLCIENLHGGFAGEPPSLDAEVIAVEAKLA